MNPRLRIAIVAGCLFVAGMHLRTAGHLLRDGWFGPYHTDDVAAPEEANVASTPESGVGAAAHDEARVQQAVLALRTGRRPGM